jgi:hypothetical protein
MQHIAGKIVESKEQIISTTTGSSRSNTVAGAGGMVYGGGGTGTVSTHHRSLASWKIFTTDEQLVTYDHFCDIEGEVGDVVAIFEDDKRNLIGIYNFTQDMTTVDNWSYARVAKAFGKFVVLSLVILIFLSSLPGKRLADSTIVMMMLVPLYYPVLEWIRVSGRKSQIRKMTATADYIRITMQVQIADSIDRLKQKLRAI